MRTIEQIEAEITQATQQKAEITNRIRALENEKRATVKAQFEADKNVRVGDTLTTKDGKTVYYQGFSTEFGCLVMVADMKKDGTPSKRIGHYLTTNFI